MGGLSAAVPNQQAPSGGGGAVFFNPPDITAQQAFNIAGGVGDYAATNTPTLTKTASGQMVNEDKKLGDGMWIADSNIGNNDRASAAVNQQQSIDAIGLPTSITNGRATFGNGWNVAEGGGPIYSANPTPVSATTAPMTPLPIPGSPPQVAATLAAGKAATGGSTQVAAMGGQANAVSLLNQTNEQQALTGRQLTGS